MSDATTFSELPLSIVHHVLTCECMDVRSLFKVSCVSRELRDFVKENRYEFVYELLRKTQQKFLMVLFGKKGGFANSDINVCVFYDVLHDLERVANMKKKLKYQHLLVPLYNSSLFKLSRCLDKEEQQTIEQNTLQILMCLLDFVKSEYNITNQPYQKTNLSVWAAYPLLDYIAMSISDSDRKSNTKFLGSDMRDIIVDRVNFMERELYHTKDCSKEIKYRFAKLLGFLSHEYKIHYNNNDSEAE